MVGLHDCRAAHCLFAPCAHLGAGAIGAAGIVLGARRAGGATLALPSSRVTCPSELAAGVGRPPDDVSRTKAKGGLPARANNLVPASGAGDKALFSRARGYR